MINVVHALRETPGATLALRSSDGQNYVYYGHGLRDLWELLNDHPERLVGAWICDRVVGVGAAALMIAGGVSRVHALTVSQRALTLLHENGVTITAESCVEAVLNADMTGPSPVERLCAPFNDVFDMLPAIDSYLIQNT